MAHIRIQFVLGTGIGSEAISWFSAGHLSHVDCLLDDHRLLGARSDHVGGEPPGVRIRPPGYATFRRRVVFTLRVTPRQRTQFLSFLQNQIGKPYDRLAILAFAFARNWNDDGSWYCAELIAAALEHAGIVSPLVLAANKITPVALALVLSAIGAQEYEDYPLACAA